MGGSRVSCVESVLCDHDVVAPASTPATSLLVKPNLLPLAGTMYYYIEIKETARSPRWRAKCREKPSV